MKTSHPADRQCGRGFGIVSVRNKSRLRSINTVKTSEVISAWGKILRGERPSLSIEITRECPLQCPGCYAYDDAHLGGGATLRSLADRKGQVKVADFGPCIFLSWAAIHWSVIASWRPWFHCC